MRGLRVADELWKAAAAKAEKEGATTTDVIVAALQEYVRSPPGETITQRMEELERRGAELERQMSRSGVAPDSTKLAIERLAWDKAMVMVPSSFIVAAPGGPGEDPNRVKLRTDWVAFYKGEGDQPDHYVVGDKLVRVDGQPMPGMGMW